VLDEAVAVVELTPEQQTMLDRVRHVLGASASHEPVGTP
jgi:hypothetical protein